MAEDVSKKDMKSLLMSHEKRETKEQEKKESPREQDLEDRLGIHEKKAFWRGFAQKDAARKRQ